MSNNQIKNEQWDKIAEFLHQHPKVYVGNQKERRILDHAQWCPVALAAEAIRQMEQCLQAPPKGYPALV